MNIESGNISGNTESSNIESSNIESSNTESSNIESSNIESSNTESSNIELSSIALDTITVPAARRQELSGVALVEFVATQNQSASNQDTGNQGAGSTTRQRPVGATQRYKQLWVEDVAPGDDQLLAPLGFFPHRDLWQLRLRLPCSLPAGYEEVKVRPFAQADAAAFLSVNKRAFAWHPEQGQLNLMDLRTRMTEPWFDTKGFLLLELPDSKQATPGNKNPNNKNPSNENPDNENPDNENPSSKNPANKKTLAGFCWTKIHTEHTPPLGEIYVIAVDPSFAGQRLGLPLTFAGLQYMANEGITDGMLYVESDNAPANRIYKDLGFELHQVNRAYRSVARPV